jgi:hypothetical protein
MHVMLDLETWGTAPGSAIRSIGAVAFEMGSDKLHPTTFYNNIEDASCEAAGLTRDDATVTWWSKQSTNAQQLLEQNQIPIAEALSKFFEWFKFVDGKEVWAQGAAFDPVLMEAAFKATSVTCPWFFWNIRDTRTAYDIAGLKYHDEPRIGVEHYALDDCRHQVKLLRMALGRLRGDGKENFQ